MTQTSHLKATALTNLDSAPPTQNNPGMGTPAFLKQVDGFVTALAGDATGTTYQLCRVPSTAIIKDLSFQSEAQGAGKVQIGVAYSTSTTDGTQANNQNTNGTPNTIDSKFFSDDIDCTSAVAYASYIRTSGGTNTIAKSQQPLWQAAGLSTDPGGYLDILCTVHTTAITTGTGNIYISVQYTI